VNQLEQGLRAVTADVTAAGYGFALVGGLAVSARAEPRLTRDADLAVAVESDESAEALVRELRSRLYEPTAAVQHDVSGRLASVRLERKVNDRVLVTDLLFASCGIEPEIVADAQMLVLVPELELPVATVGHLIAMKLLARDDRNRPTDADDLAALARVATTGDWRDATEAVRLINERGFDRGRNLVEALTELRGSTSAD
jgi:predicted nucleotidyltransferase